MGEIVLFRCEEIWLTRVNAGGEPQHVLCGLTVGIPADGITCLTGPSGSGKSTLLRLLNRLEDPDQGRVLYRGRDLRELNPLHHRRQVGLVLQSPVMLPGTVQENLEAGLRLRGQRLADPAAWLDRVGLPAGYLAKSARELSGGEKQRVALARTLATEPEVLLLDEVTSSLDPDSTAVVETLIRALAMPVVWVSHDMQQVKRVADRVIHLQAGRVAEEVGVR